jgi:hypothetical protein
MINLTTCLEFFSSSYFKKPKKNQPNVVNVFVSTLVLKYIFKYAIVFTHQIDQCLRIHTSDDLMSIFL